MSWDGLFLTMLYPNHLFLCHEIPLFLDYFSCSVSGFRRGLRAFFFPPSWRPGDSPPDPWGTTSFSSSSDGRLCRSFHMATDLGVPFYTGSQVIDLVSSQRFFQTQNAGVFDPSLFSPSVPVLFFRDPSLLCASQRRLCILDSAAHCDNRAGGFFVPYLRLSPCIFWFPFPSPYQRFPGFFPLVTS